MRYVIIRDDDTNALTPVECLERLYRPFLKRGLPVNLAVIPDVATGTTLPDGTLEGFLSVRVAAPEHGAGHREEVRRLRAREAPLPFKRGAQVALAEPVEAPHTAAQAGPRAPISSNVRLVEYLQASPGFHVVQHGCHHDYFEFDSASRAEVAQRLDHGTRLLREAGFPAPETFVAPYDKLSRVSLREVARRFRVLSTGWFELRRLPRRWWPKYLLKKLRGAPHWKIGGTTLLSHPGCLLSCHRRYDTMLDEVIRNVESRHLTVLVTHWWEYFREGEADGMFIHFLHQTAEYLASHPDIRVVTFADVARGTVRIN